MKGRCPDCGVAMRGDEVCACCGAFDFGGVTSWVCFTCGGQNAHGTAVCACGRARTMECSACGADVPFGTEKCECGMERFAFDAATQARERLLEIKRTRVALRALAVVACTLGVAGVLLAVTAATRTGRAVAVAMIALSVAGAAYRVVTGRRLHRELQ